MRRVLAWRDDLNLYTTGGSNVTTYLPEPLVVGPQNLADWNRFWVLPAGMPSKGESRYQGGNLLTRLRTSPEKLTPDDFRLRPDTPAIRQARMAKIWVPTWTCRPRAAYERWRKRPIINSRPKYIGQVQTPLITDDVQ